MQRMQLLALQFPLLQIVSFRIFEISNSQTSQRLVSTFPNSRFKISKTTSISNFEFSKLSKSTHRTIMCTYLPNFSELQVLKFENIFFKDIPIISCILKYFGDECGARGSRFGHMFGRSKNIPKSVAIAQESLLSNSGRIKTPPTNP